MIFSRVEVRSKSAKSKNKQKLPPQIPKQSERFFNEFNLLMFFRRFFCRFEFAAAFRTGFEFEFDDAINLFGLERFSEMLFMSVLCTDFFLAPSIFIFGGFDDVGSTLVVSEIRYCKTSTLGLIHAALYNGDVPLAFHLLVALGTVPKLFRHFELSRTLFPGNFTGTCGFNLGTVP